MNPVTPPPPPQSFEERIARVRLWTLIPTVLVLSFAWRQLERHLGLPQVSAQRMHHLLNDAFLLGWWVVMARPRPFSVRATLGRPLDLSGWGSVMLLLFGVFCLRIVWWITRTCWEQLQAGGTLPSSFAFRQGGSYATAFDAVLFSMILAPVIEELLFRGTLFRKWRLRFGPGKAVLLSSLIFGAIHADKVAASLMGFTLALFYTRTRSLGAAMVLHSLNNSVGTGLEHWWNPVVLRLDSPWKLCVFAPIILVGVGVWVQFVRKSWRTLGDALPPDSLRATPTALPSSLLGPVRAGG